MQEGAITASVGTQTEVYIMPEENLQILAQKTFRGIDVNADHLDRTLFANLRQLLGNEPFNTKLADLMGYQPGIYPTILIRRKISKKPERIGIESIRKDIEVQTPSILSILTGDILDRCMPLCENLDAHTVSTDTERNMLYDSGIPETITDSDKKVSIEISLMLSLLGYGPRIRQARIDAYTEGDRVWNARSTKRHDVKVITAGSKAEGLTSYYESDRDGIYMLPLVLCVEHGIDIHTIPLEMTVFRTNAHTYAHPGHCTLLLERLGHNGHPVFLSALFHDSNGRWLLSSDIFVQECSSADRDPNEVRHTRAGPSNPATFVGVLKTDTVFAISLQCPNILQRWAKRARRWPSPEIVKTVVSMGALVAPVGFKGSENKNVEWRVCFNTGEAYLMNCLNNTQINLYVLLKLIVKNVLNPIKKELTSYIVKNIVLWLAETNPEELFQETRLLEVLRLGLEKLRTVICSKKLPYYMIEERNLMEACDLKDEQQHTWDATIAEMINEGPRLILRLSKMRQALNTFPQSLLWFAKTKAELEILTLEYRNRSNHCKDDKGLVDESDIVLQETLRRLNEILVQVRERLLCEGSCINDVNEIHERMLK